MLLYMIALQWKSKSQPFREKDCSLKKALIALQMSESVQKLLKGISDEGIPNPVNAVKLKKSSTYKKPNSFCKYCGGKHELDRTHCPAYGKTCHQCGKTYHFTLCACKEKEVSNLYLSYRSCRTKHLRLMKKSLQLKKWELLNMTKRSNFLCHCALSTSRDPQS